MKKLYSTFPPEKPSPKQGWQPWGLPGLQKLPAARLTSPNSVRPGRFSNYPASPEANSDNLLPPHEEKRLEN